MAGQPYKSSAAAGRADGVYRWFYLRAFPLRDAEGRIACVSAANRYSTKQKRAEALLAAKSTA